MIKTPAFSKSMVNCGLTDLRYEYAFIQQQRKRERGHEGREKLGKRERGRRETKRRKRGTMEGGKLGKQERG